jgi:hypothetical protein
VKDSLDSSLHLYWRRGNWVTLIMANPLTLGLIYLFALSVSNILRKFCCMTSPP